MSATTLFERMNGMPKFVVVKLLIFILISGILASFPMAVQAEEPTNAISLQKEEILLQPEEPAAFDCNVSAAGMYSLRLEYLAPQDDTVLTLDLDGTPLATPDSFKLYSLWKDEQGIVSDTAGNDIRPRQVRAEDYFQVNLYNFNDNSENLFTVTLTEGAHTLHITAVDNPVKLREVYLVPYVPAEAYNSYHAKDNGHSPSGVYEKVQGEAAVLKSGPELFPSSDRSSPSVEPNDPEKMRLNMVGGGSYKNKGQFMVWNIEAPEDGYYTLSFKYRQNTKRGMDSCRRLLVDGELLFQELGYLRFPYGRDWSIQTLGDEAPYRIFLSAGAHTLTLEVVEGEAAETFDHMEQLVMRLNECYRKIIMVTSTAPDTLRDYNLDREIPELVPDLQAIRSELKTCLSELERLSADKGSESSFINRILSMLDDFIKYPEKIQERLTAFSSNISSLSQFTLSGREQPLELDYIVLASPEQHPGKGRAGFLETVSFRFKRFMASFFQDYSRIGETLEGTKTPLNVWISVNDMAATGVAVGRDQSQIFKNIVNRLYTPETGQPVNVSLINSGDALMQAVMAKTGPDVALFTAKTMPINLALRESVLCLDEMPNGDEIRSRFHPAALKAFTLDGKLYALPDSMVYNVLFYRTDIAAELDISPPKTWKEFYAAVSKLQKKNLLTGVAENNMIFEMLLLQKGASLYNDEVSEVTLSDPKAVEAFSEWCKMYSLYEMPLRFDAFSRFRTGEMPMLIAPYTLASQLTSAAPELKGLWRMSEMPGTMQEGELIKSETLLTTGAIVIKDTKDKEGAFRFLDWWTSDDIQSEYAGEIEASLGPAARYTTANINAFDTLGWDKDTKNVLKTQRQDLDDFYASAASYYISRNITNAFRKVVLKNTNPRDTLNAYSRDMQQELERKRKEFGLSSGQ